MEKIIIFLFFISLSVKASSDDQLKTDLDLYRNLSLSVRKFAQFKISLPSGDDDMINYQLDFGEPVYLSPLWGNLYIDSSNQQKFYRTFYDRIFLKDGSKIQIGDDFVPLTCIFIKGQDNRYSGNTSPLFPKFVLKVFLVANDYSCIGPINPGYPDNGGREETWDTYLSFTIKDPTIMLPTDSIFRFKWNEYNTVLIK